MELVYHKICGVESPRYNVHHYGRQRHTPFNRNNYRFLKTYQGISYFTAEDYELECCLVYDLPDGSFTLVFDEAPDFDGELVEEPEMENVFYFKKSA